MTAEAGASTSMPASDSSGPSTGAPAVATAQALDPDAIRWDAHGLVPVIVQDAADGRVLMLAYADREALDATTSTGDVHFHSRSRDALWRKGETSGNVLRLARLEVDCDGDAILATVEPTGPTCHRGTRSCFDPEESVPSGGALAPAGQAGASGGALAPAGHTTASGQVPAGHTTASGQVPAGHTTASGQVPAGHTTARAEDPAPSGVEPTQGFAWLETLSATITDRARRRPAGSYTTSLIEGGVDATARKVAEEATEVVLAAKDDAAAARSGFDRSATRSALAGEAADLVYHLLVVLAERDLAAGEVIEILKARHRA